MPLVADEVPPDAEGLRRTHDVHEHARRGKVTLELLDVVAVDGFAAEPEHSQAGKRRVARQRVDEGTERRGQGVDHADLIPPNPCPQGHEALPRKVVGKDGGPVHEGAVQIPDGIGEAE